MSPRDTSTATRAGAQASSTASDPKAKPIRLFTSHPRSNHHSVLPQGANAAFVQASPVPHKIPPNLKGSAPHKVPPVPLKAEVVVLDPETLRHLHQRPKPQSLPSLKGQDRRDPQIVSGNSGKSSSNSNSNNNNNNNNNNRQQLRPLPKAQ